MTVTSRHPVALLPSLAGPSARSSGLAWAGSTAISVVLVSSLAAFALTNQSQSGGESLAEAESAIMLTLAPAPAIEAMSEPSPEVETSLDAPEPEPVTEAPPETPDVMQTPDLAELPDQPSLDPIAEDVPVIDDTTPPQVSEMVIPKAKPKPRPERKPEPEPKPVEKAEKPKDPPKQKPKPAPSQTVDGAQGQKATAAATSAGAGSKAAKSYGSDVMKKIRRTKKRRAPDRGVAVVQFSVTANGSLGAVSLAKSSGSAGLDDVALDHIRRSAPFPAPPPGAQTKFSFEFKS